MMYEQRLSKTQYSHFDVLKGEFLLYRMLSRKQSTNLISHLRTKFCKIQRTADHDRDKCHEFIKMAWKQSQQGEYMMLLLFEYLPTLDRGKGEVKDREQEI